MFNLHEPDESEYLTYDRAPAVHWSAIGGEVEEPTRPATRLEEQDEAQPLAWTADALDLEEQGLALAIEALHRAQWNRAAADAWLLKRWRSAPDDRERVMQSAALVHVRSLAGRTANATLGALVAA